jgi:hypothetical protein
MRFSRNSFGTVFGGLKYQFLSIKLKITEKVKFAL